MRCSWLQHLILEGVLVICCAALTVAEPRFLSFDNLLNILRSVSEWGIIALGMTMVIIAGEIDLSVGSAVAFSGCLIGWLIEAGTPAPLAIALALAIGGGAGGLVGLLRAWCRVPSFISTLALMSAMRGGAMLISGGAELTSFPAWYKWLGLGLVAGVPVPALIFLLTFAAVALVMNFTTLGRAIYAVGGNAEAARLSGIRVTAVRAAVLCATGLLSVLAGVLVSARLQRADDQVGTGWELDVIAAVIVGGTSLSGGAGSVWRTLVGVLLIGAILNGMTLLGIKSEWQYVVRGAVILLAVLANQLQQRAAA